MYAERALIKPVGRHSKPKMLRSHICAGSSYSQTGEPVHMRLRQSVLAPRPQFEPLTVQLTEDQEVLRFQQTGGSIYMRLRQEFLALAGSF